MNRRQLLFGAAAAAVAPAAVPAGSHLYHSGAGEYLVGIDLAGPYKNFPELSDFIHVHEFAVGESPDGGHFVASPQSLGGFINRQGWLIPLGVFGIADK